MGGVADADVDGVLVWTVETPLRQPHRQPGAAASGVDDELCIHDIPRIQPDAGHPAPGGVVAGLADRGMHHVHVVDRGHPSPDLPFQLRSARYICGELVLQSMAGAQDVAGRAEVNAVGPILQNRYPGGHHVVEQSREMLVELLGTARHQQVHVPALRHRGPVGWAVGQLVAFVDRHPVIEVRQAPAPRTGPRCWPR